MSEYQYYEFCKLNMPLTAEARKEMYSLSSRAKVSTHGASFVYHYGDFRGDPKKILLKHFDVFFYISNWGSIQVIFKYPAQEINSKKLKNYCIKDLINCETKSNNILLVINFDNEDGFGWIEGEGMLSDILPLYDEIKSGDYQFLRLIADVSKIDTENDAEIILTQAQKAFFKYVEIDL